MKVLVLSMFFLTQAFAAQMILRQGPIRSGKIFIPCSFDLIDYECFFDSGAQKSNVPFASFEDYQKVGQYMAGGASGAKLEYDEILIKKLEVGEFFQENFKVGRLKLITNEENEDFMIGSGFFSNRSIYFDFKHKLIEHRSRKIFG
ncbi:MAG: hypothetical protein HON90_02735 [Halobacteriovoraceae bacterium]|jgi:hypothetical protein|nr:hypothetical protein [Halobacteriovoraceae bacterium]